MSLDKTFRALRLDSGAVVTKFDTTATLAANSDNIVPTQKAVKTYVDARVTAGVDTTTTLGTSDTVVPSQKAVKTYVDNAVVDGIVIKDSIVLPMSFETGEVGQYKLYFPMKVTINKIRTQVVKALAATDAGTITCGNSTGASATGVCTHAASAIYGDAQVASPTTNNVVLANGYYYFTSAKTTAGGKVLVSVEYTLTA